MTITLLSGMVVDDSDLTFDPDTYHFTYNGLDVTNDISRTEKLALVPGFDITKENFRLSNESGNGVGKYGTVPLNDSTLSNFVNQIETDPLGAPIDALNKGVSALVSSSGIRTLAIGAGVLLAVVLFVKYK